MRQNSLIPSIADTWNNLPEKVISLFLVWILITYRFTTSKCWLISVIVVFKSFAVQGPFSPHFIFFPKAISWRLEPLHFVKGQIGQLRGNKNKTIYNLKISIMWGISDITWTHSLSSLEESVSDRLSWWELIIIGTAAHLRHECACDSSFATDFQWCWGRNVTDGTLLDCNDLKFQGSEPPKFFFLKIRHLFGHCVFNASRLYCHLLAWRTLDGLLLQTKMDIVIFIYFTTIVCNAFCFVFVIYWHTCVFLYY